MLKAFSQRLAECIRNTDTVARLAGDEFVVLMEGILRPEEAQFVARKIVSAVRQPMDIDGATLQVTTSIGLACYGGESVLTAGELMAQADQALYRVKAAGRNGYRLVLC